jgi:DNA end-binding protein Ku
MPSILRKGAIQFGLVYIPVNLYTTVTEGRTGFNQLHRDSHARIRYKKVREDTGQEVSADEIVKGYQYEPGKYVVLDDDELERMKSSKDKAINILQFAPHDSINPVFCDKTYYLTPDGSDKAYALLHAAMSQENVTAVAHTVLGTSETMLTITPMGNGSLLMETLYFMDEVKPVPQPVSRIEVNDAELNMARAMIQTMKGTYQPEQYRDTYAEKLHDVLLRKIQGQEAVEPKENAIGAADLMDALQRSLQQMSGLRESQKGQEAAFTRLAQNAQQQPALNSQPHFASPIPFTPPQAAPPQPWRR